MLVNKAQPRQVVFLFVLVYLGAFSALASAADWMRFRGPNGSGIAAESTLPISWSETENLKWQVPLPGPGSSSPIIVGERIFVTCYTGYGIDADDPGVIADLTRHLLCIDATTGETQWQRSVSVVLPEDPYSGFITEHGYASSTPVSDGQQIFAFFGKSGVVAYDLQGNELWQTSVGTESGTQHWGSAASPILFGDLVIVNASEEGEAVVALNKVDGKEVWRAEAEGFASLWGTPIIAKLPEGEELVIAVPGEVWGMNLATGKLRWHAMVSEARNLCSSPVIAGDVVYVVGGRDGGSAAVRIGGKGDVTDSHTLWNNRQRGKITSPIVHQGHLYWYAGGILSCAVAETGELVYRERLSSSGAADRDGVRGMDYASPVLVDGKLYVPDRRGNLYVVAAQPEFELLATNSFESDPSDFNATPAVGDGFLVIRSNQSLYCISAQ